MNADDRCGTSAAWRAHGRKWAPSSRPPPSRDDGAHLRPCARHAARSRPAGPPTSVGQQPGPIPRFADTRQTHRHERTGSSRAASKASISAQLAHALCPHGNSRTTSPVPGVPQLTSLPQYTQGCGSCIGTSLLMRSVTAPCLSIHRHVCQNVLVAHLYHAFLQLPFSGGLLLRLPEFILPPPHPSVKESSVRPTGEIDLT
jgi:hypothetical protein